MKRPTAALPKSPGKLIAETKEDRGIAELQWQKCIRFLRGQQNLRPATSKTSSMMVEQAAGSKTGGSKRTLTINHLLNLYRKVLSELTIAFPGIVVMPASNSNEDIVKAKSAEMALRWYWQASNLKDTLEEALGYAVTYGTAGLVSYWSPERDGIVTDAVHPSDLFFEKGARSVGDARWVAVRRWHTKDELAEAYPESKDHILAMASEEQFTIDGRQMADDRVETYEFYFKDGRHGIACGDEWVFPNPKRKDEDGNPEESYAVCEAVQVIRYTAIPDSPWGIGLLEPVLDLQYHYNRGRTRIAQNTDMMANPKALIPNGCGISSTAFTDRPGEKIFYNHQAGQPSYLNPPEIKQWVIEDIVRTQAEMMDVSGIHSAALGKRSVGVTSGVAIEKLSNESTSQLQHTQQQVEKAFGKLAKAILQLMRTWFDEARWVSILDDAGVMVYEQIDATQFKENPEVIIEAGTMFADSVATRERRALELFANGLLTADEVLETINFRTASARGIAKIQAIAHAREMLEAVKAGALIQIFQTDDLKAFERVFGEFMRTREYYLLPEERQQYVADVFAGIIAAGQPSEVYQQARAMNQVWPRQDAPQASPTQKAGTLAATGSPLGQQQVAAEQARMTAQTRVASRMAGEHGDAIKSPIRGPMG